MYSGIVIRTFGHKCIDSPVPCIVPSLVCSKKIYLANFTYHDLGKGGFCIICSWFAGKTAYMCIYIFVLYLVASVNVQVMVLSSENSVSLKLNEAMTVQAAKFTISKKLGIQPYQQKLLCTGKKLKDHLTLSHYSGLPEWPSLQLIESML